MVRGELRLRVQPFLLQFLHTATRRQCEVNDFTTFTYLTTEVKIVKTSEAAHKKYTHHNFDNLIFSSPSQILRLIEITKSCARAEEVEGY